MAQYTPLLRPTTLSRLQEAQRVGDYWYFAVQRTSKLSVGSVTDGTEEMEIRSPAAKEAVFPVSEQDDAPVPIEQVTLVLDALFRTVKV